jgi:hypothetical protein
MAVISQNYRLLPIIFNIREVKITESYHKFLRLTRIGDTMAVSLISEATTTPQHINKKKGGPFLTPPSL